MLVMELPGRVREDSGMRLPVLPPVKPMLAKAVAEVPLGAYLYAFTQNGGPVVALPEGAPRGPVPQRPCAGSRRQA